MGHVGHPRKPPRVRAAMGVVMSGWGTVTKDGPYRAVKPPIMRKITPITAHIR